MGNGNPEKSLLAAVLLRAVRDLIIYSRAFTPEEKRVAKAAHDWIFDCPEDEGHVTSFSNICLVMDLDPILVRRRINTMRRAEINKASRELRSQSR